jgi:hypothetical protein
MLQHIIDVFACNDARKWACECQRELVSKSLWAGMNIFGIFW